MIRRTKPARIIADELGASRKTPCRGMEVSRQQPAEPCVTDGERVREREQADSHLPAETAIVKAVEFDVNGPT
jgi:hypothetical protein